MVFYLYTLCKTFVDRDDNKTINEKRNTILTYMFSFLPDNANESILDIVKIETGKIIISSFIIIKEIIEEIKRMNVIFFNDGLITDDTETT